MKNLKNIFIELNFLSNKSVSTVCYVFGKVDMNKFMKYDRKCRVPVREWDTVRISFITRCISHCVAFIELNIFDFFSFLFLPTNVTH